MLTLADHVKNGENVQLNNPHFNNIVQSLLGKRYSFFDYINGKVDFDRQLEMLGIQNDFTADQNAKMMAFNADEAQKAREWQEMMSNTAYSRAMADAKSAGINPAFIFSQGGASTPTGSSAYVTAQGSSSNSRGSNNVAGLTSTIISNIGGVANTAIRALASIYAKTRF